jgi:beta-phosphoglucomutase-like phosphatase (HAD superfamily)
MQNALIFDMDGTMVDNMMVHHRAWQKKLAELGK